ncbi:MAG: hypothetical protein ABIT96_11310 [Ferruginibacter sp.]
MNKAIICVAICVCFLPGAVSAQDMDYKKPPTIAVHLALNDFQTAADVRKNGLGDVLAKGNWTSTKRMYAGLGISYMRGISNLLDFATTLTGSYVNYPVPNTIGDGQNHLLLEAVATANLKLLPDNFCVVPYITAGLGASKYKGYYGAIMPIGLGIQAKVIDQATLFINTQYRIPVTTTTGAYHLYHSFGIGFTMPKKVMTPAVDVTMPASN